MAEKQWYTKINTCFKRDMVKDSPTYNCIIPDQLTTPEFELFREAKIKWHCTEKVDGECTSIHFIPVIGFDPFGKVKTWVDPNGEVHKVVLGYNIEVHGKTAAANMRPDEVELLKGLISEETFLKVFTRHRINGAGMTWELSPEEEIIIFGETYGKGMQKAGGRYCADRLRFICFDIQIGGVWLKPENVMGLCYGLGIDYVPYKGDLTLDEAIEMVRHGFLSAVSDDPTLEAEGLVLRAPLGMLDRLGRRIITKVKTKDFRDLEKKLPKC